MAAHRSSMPEDPIAALIRRSDDMVGRTAAATIPAARRQLVGVVGRMASMLRTEETALIDKLDAGWAWLAGHPGHTRYAVTEDRWLAYLASYEAVCDAIVRADRSIRSVA